jgi:beta-lactamase class A
MTRLRRRHLPRRRVLVFGVLVIAAAMAAGLLATDRATRQAATAKLTASRLAIFQDKAPEAPSALQSRLDVLAAGYGEDVGIAVTDVASGWTAGVGQHRLYPQQSVSKLWVAIALMRAVDAGRIDLNAWVTMDDADRSVFFQPVVAEYRQGSYVTPVSDLLRRALVESDNAANDRLMRELGGPEGVRAALEDMGLTDVKVGAYERDLQAQTAGLSWRHEYGFGRNFQNAREALPMAVREAAADAYVADPLDGASPAAITAALAALSRGALLSEESTLRITSLMTAARTGPRRLKGGLPPGWSIAHKTGTGQDFQGASLGINDVGLLTAPDGRTYAVAVMLPRTRHAVTARLAFIQSVSGAVVEQWMRETGTMVAD